MEVVGPYPWLARDRGDKGRRAELVSRYLKLVSGETEMLDKDGGAREGDG